jgi:hypothetical protein
MAKIKSSKPKKSTAIIYPTMLRVAGRDLPLHTVLHNAQAAQLPVQLHLRDDAAGLEDSAEIDPTLALGEAADPPAPPLGIGYAGLSPDQRHAFLRWAAHPATPASAAYQQLYIANLEPRLLENGSQRKLTWGHLHQLHDAEGWRGNPWLIRALLLGAWLEGNGNLLAAVLAVPGVPADLLNVGLGLQALCDTPMTEAELGATLRAWQIGPPLMAELLKLRLDSLSATLSMPPLAFVRAALDEAALVPRPWRTAHRGLRLALPMPDVRVHLEPILRDLNTVTDVAPLNPNPDQLADAPEADPDDEENGTPELESLGWRLILEFSSNRSEYFDYTLIQCQKLPGYSQLMDEDRRMIYRVVFRKSEMRRFWRIWEYVQSWTSTRIYLNGTELEKWKIWPYSQYLR